MKSGGFSWHVQMDVESALALDDRDLIDWFGNSGLSLADIKKDLNQQKETGRVYVHTQGCDNYDSVTGKCLGH